MCSWSGTFLVRKLLNSQSRKVARGLLLWCGVAMIGAAGCYMDWDDIAYRETCSPLEPETVCGSHSRCQPQSDGDPECEEPLLLESNQNGFCESNEACGVLETCMTVDEQLPSKICMQFCQSEGDCPTDYTCSKSGHHQMEIRGEAWGVCLRVPPYEWTCDPGYYAGGAGGNDNQCDCGCGVFDPDCLDESDTSCERCTAEATARCVPEGWLCSDTKYVDEVCDCGCGVLDKNGCDSISRDSCENCPVDSCGFGDCGSAYAPILPDDNTQCKKLPNDWDCGLAAYWDGASCDCGCGVVDPDCDGPENTYCSETCLEGSCADTDCSIESFSPTDNSQCAQ